jgi:hypothetical protein
MGMTLPSAETLSFAQGSATLSTSDDGENKITGIKFKNKETGECFINTPKSDS